MRAFVTGGTGFLGRRLVRRLAEHGDEVVALAREGSDASELERLGAEVVRGDLATIDAVTDRLRGCDVVFHVGARVVSHGDWDVFYAANVAATEKLVDAACAAGVRRFVHVSSLGIFELAGEGMTVTEATDYDHHPALRGHYTRSKIQADRVASLAARTGKPVVIVRPGQLYGYDHPQQPVFLGRVKKFLRPDLLAVVSDPDYLVPVTYIENAADAVYLAGVAEGIEGRAFNVVDDPDLTQAAYFGAMSRARGRRLRVLYVPVGLFAPAVMAVDALFRIAKRRPWAVAHQLLRSGRSARYSTDSARTELGWVPNVDLEQALRIALAEGQ